MALYDRMATIKLPRYHDFRGSKRGGTFQLTCQG